jgi:hypothetical protein
MQMWQNKRMNKVLQACELKSDAVVAKQVGTHTLATLKCSTSPTKTKKHVLVSGLKYVVGVLVPDGEVGDRGKIGQLPGGRVPSNRVDD